MATMVADAGEGSNGGGEGSDGDRLVACGLLLLVVVVVWALVCVWVVVL